MYPWPRRQDDEKWNKDALSDDPKVRQKFFNKYPYYLEALYINNFLYFMEMGLCKNEEERQKIEKKWARKKKIKIFNF